MSILYMIALCVVFLAFIAVTAEAVLSVSKQTPWLVVGAKLSLVATPERRVNDLRYIGPERRAGHGAADEAPVASGRQAA